MDIDFIDVNFDGYNDLKIFDCNANWYEHNLYFLWDMGKNMYVSDTQGLSDLGLPRFDEEEQVVYSMDKSGAGNRNFYTHKYINGILTVIEDVSEIADISFKDNVTDEQLASIVPILSKYSSYSFIYDVTKRLNYNTSKMETVESKYLLSVLNDNDWTIIDEYDADSDIGKQLEKLVDWQQ